MDECVAKTRKKRSRSKASFGRKSRKKSKKKEKEHEEEENCRNQTNNCSSEEVEEKPVEIKSYISANFHQSVLEKIAGHPRFKRVRSRIWSTHLERSFEDTFSNEVSSAEDYASLLPQTFSMMFDSWMDENSPDGALNHLLPVMTAKWYLPPRIIYALFSILLKKSGSTVCREKTRISLTRLTQCHPPVTLKARKMYLDAFSSVSTKKNPCWTLFSSVIGKCLSTQDSDCIFLFTVLVEILEKDFKRFLNGVVAPSEQLGKSEDCPLVCHIFWPDMEGFFVNQICKEFFKFLSDALKYDNILTVVQRLLNLVVECVRLEELTYRSQREQSAFSTKCQSFALELIDSCAVVFQEKSLVIKFVTSLQAVWLQMLVSELLLQSMGFLNTCNTPLSLKKIITYLMFPDFAKSPRKVRTKMTRLSRIINAKEMFYCEEIHPVNCRNRKGETDVHCACADGDETLLKKLLRAPGIDVNAQDNAGWTPLHEACWHGHCNCVNILLRWRPQPGHSTRDSSKSAGLVDLFAASIEEGLTPLHVAVIKDDLKLATILLEQGGLSLLDVKDKQGDTPLNLAKSSEMADLLKSNSELKIPGQKGEFFEDEEEQNQSLPSAMDNSKVSSKKCKEFLEYVYHLITSYVSWHCLREVNEAWSLLKEAYPVLRPDLVADMYQAIYSVSSTDETVIKRLYDDLLFIPEIPEYLQSLKSHIEKLTGLGKESFELEFLALKIAMDV